MYNTEPSQLIRQRYSCRTYQKRPIADHDLSMLDTFLQHCKTGPFGNQIRLKIVPASEYDSRSLPKLGTYGFIRDPAAFIIGSNKDEPGALVDFGYAMELLILKATELGIGSCWLGGTFTKSSFSRLMSLESGEEVPCVTSLGYPADQQAWLDRISRVYAGSDRRLPWNSLFFTDAWESSLSEDQAGVFAEPLRLVRLAPSASNKQPWRVLRDGQRWHFYLARTSNYPSPVFGPLLGTSDLQLVDMGIAISHFELGLTEIGARGEWLMAEPGFMPSKTTQEYIITWQPITENNQEV